MEPAVRWAVLGAKSKGSMVGIVLWVAANVAVAQNNDHRPRVDWKCVQEHDEQFHIACIARPARGDSLTLELLLGDVVWADASGDAGPQSISVRAFRGLDLRPVATREAAAVFSPSPWRVPLYAPPSNTTAVIQLLQAVLCGSALGCTVSYER